MMLLMLVVHWRAGVGAALSTSLARGKLRARRERELLATVMETETGKGFSS
jgi:hypothetical protein